MTGKAIVSGAVYIPCRSQQDWMRPLHISHFKLGQNESETIVAMDDESRPGYVGVPRQYGLKLISRLGLTAKIEVSYGTDVHFPYAVSLRDYQIPFVKKMESLCTNSPTIDFLAQAATGKGKTVMGLALAQRLGVTTLVVVDQENLLHQWIDRAKEHLKLTDKDIGIVQGDVFEFAGKKLVIAMMQTLTRRKYPVEFYKWPGLVLFDEFYITGAPTFSKVLMAFPAAWRIGLSATPKRRDDLQRLIDYSLGKIEVKLTDKHKASSVYVLENDTTYSWYANISKMTGRFIDEVANDGRRNLRIISAAVYLYEQGHDILLVSDRIEQLQNLCSALRLMGVPDEDVDVYAGNRFVWKWEKDPKPKHRPYGYVRGTEYTPVKFSFVKKKIPKKELAHIKDTAKIICATYGIFSKGVDVPRLSAGIDCTPRSQATQVFGRILRESRDKLSPVWVTIRDTNSYRAEYQLAQRLPEYVSSNAEVFLWNPVKGIKKLDVGQFTKTLRTRIASLQEKKIITRIDGNYMLQT